MAVRKYVGDESIKRVASYVNRKLTVVSAMPLSPEKGMVRLYIGLTTQDYVQGGIYLYDGTQWVLLSQTDVDLTYYETSFTGTQAEWEALGDEQAKYDIVNITDDYVPGTSDHVISGYYYEGTFYAESTHETELTPAAGYVYIDLDSDVIYVYDEENEEYIAAAGGGTDSIVFGYYYEDDFYRDSAHTNMITPREGMLYIDLDGESAYIYKDDAYVQISGGGGGGSAYRAGFGISIDNDKISTTQFVGTAQAWEALTPAQQAAYDFINITDDTTAVDEGAPGHNISDETGEKTQRTGLKFEGFEVTDDSTNDVTKISEIPYTAGDGIGIDANKEVTTDPDLLPFTFVGTKAEWESLTAAEKAKYSLVNLIDDIAGGEMVVVDEVEEDNFNPVTSNAVAKGILLDAIIPKNAGARNSIYRGKSLGSSVTAEQYAAISAGTFDDLMIGDYWTIGGVNYRIAAFDYWLKTGNTECTTHHVVIVPDTNLYTTKMNDTDITTGGYTSSLMCSTNLASAKTTINSAFGSSHILNHRELFTSSVDANGRASGFAWKDSTVDLMNECMVYGHNTWSGSRGYETDIDKSQLPLFTLSHDSITIRASWWLRDVVSGSDFALVRSYGYANYTGASSDSGVRPAFGIIG